MIRQRDVDRAAWIIDTSGVVDILVAGYRASPRGRPANRHGLRLMLIGLFLSIAHEGKATLTAAFRVLTDGIPLDAQTKLGVIALKDSQVVPLVSLHDFYNLDLALCKNLAYSLESDPERKLSDDERARRHQAIQSYCDSLMNVFSIPELTSSTLAIDATGIWSWGRSYSKKPKELLGQFDDDDGSAETEPNGTDEAGAASVEHSSGTDAATNEQPADDDNDSGDVRDASERRFDLDAAWGVKTSKLGKNELFFGYHEHTAVQVPDKYAVDDAVPTLITRFELTAANRDIVDVTLRLLDRHPGEITDVIVDRHYHYKVPVRWKSKLVAQGIDQHHDLRSDEHGFTEAHRMRWAAGAAHCPATPDTYSRIDKPGFCATNDEWDSFFERIDLREKYAMRRMDRPGENGTHRCKCPALAGKVGCPLRAGTIDVARVYGLPIVDNPPNEARDGEPLPKCCKQATVRVTPPESVFKLMQPHTWGSKKWLRTWNRRTYVEGSYGNRKNPSTENVSRGQFQVFGLVWVHIVMGLVNASYNARMLENWCDRHPGHDVDHPLIGVADTGTVGHIEVSQREYDLLLAARAADEAA